jgi:hypothetical protein
LCGACSTNKEKRNAYGILTGKPEGKRPLGGPRRRWVNNVLKDLGEMVWTESVRFRIEPS